MDYKCQYCGGMFNHRVNLWSHLKMERGKFLCGKEGEDYLVCKECGMRVEVLAFHLKQHNMTGVQYLEKYPNEKITLPKLVLRRAAAITGTHVIPIQERSGAILCDKCGNWYLSRYAAAHLAECVAAHPDKYELNQDYVKCPECGKALSRLGEHLKKEHGWDEDKIAIQVGRGLKLMAESISEKRADIMDYDSIQTKREKNMMDKYGVSNPFELSEVKKKIGETNQRRYGVSYPMQNEDIFIRQRESSHNGPSALELFFDEHTCDNVAFTGYGGRFIRTKIGVNKYGRLIKDLNPDFMILPSNVLGSALSAIKERKPLDRQRHRSKYVVELLGDYYHSKEVIGVEPEEHVKEIMAAYKSAGIECLVLWENDVMTRWESIRSMVDAWIDKAVRDMNDNPIWSRATKNKIDRRKGDLVCPCGSGKMFRSHKQLEKWVNSPLNYWKAGLVEGKDYVKCLECGTRVSKVTEHIRKSHNMTKEQYLGKYPDARMISVKMSERIASLNRLPRV